MIFCIFADVQDDLNLHVIAGTFSLDAAHMVVIMHHTAQRIFYDQFLGTDKSRRLQMPDLDHLLVR